MSLKKPIYELRTYTLRANRLMDYINLTTQKFHLRTSHSVLNGFWFHELGGGLNAATHIWQYDSLAHRASVRAALATDSEWTGQYVSHLLPCLDKQENSVCQVPDWAEEISDFSNETAKSKIIDDNTANPYQLITVQKSEIGSGEIQCKLTELAENFGIEVVGCLQTVVGDKDKVHILLKLARVDDSLVTEIHGLQKSVVMLPTRWSPMK